MKSIGLGSLCSGHEFSFQRMILFKSAHAEHAKPQHMALFVDPFRPRCMYSS
jgi:hypothetical protein